MRKHHHTTQPEQWPHKELTIIQYHKIRHLGLISYLQIQNKERKTMWSLVYNLVIHNLFADSLGQLFRLDNYESWIGLQRAVDIAR